ncbi:AAA family ATPase [Methylobacterium nonmethylotrophicum]|uniref:DUF2813 domain-containing protein n=1 Tax=Methylobacterium nonmethylotrophicum TaxID=1141884 RepID=A0A4Z0NNJ4_9HYPH|nr:AAA family ATPase [Methylobacterium nonmethylotrophicum]TGD98257.1 DUF2813 domain-containing protein [Methylobacterium nonmethylotrophicum]
MLTRVEIDGFKSFEGLTLDLQPFTVIAGPNASGKSNFFDALRLLARLAALDLPEAVRTMRGDPSEMFRRRADGTTADAMRFAVEVLLDPEVEDAFGQRKPLAYTRLRYELEIERRADEPGGLERLYVRREQAAAIRRTDDAWARRSPLAQDFAKRRARYGTGRARTPFLETLDDTFQVNQDGRQGLPRPFPVRKGRATATVLSKITTATEFPHLFALRQELEGMTFLQLEVSAEREPSDALAPDDLLPDGSNLAKVLARIEAETRTPERPRGDIGLIRSALSALIPGVKDLRVERDEAYGRYRFLLTTQDGEEFSSRVLSDGTLRMLALLTYLYDPRRRSVLLFEEPENGINAARLARLIAVLREACTSVQAAEENDERLFQVILNTHSPVVLQATEDEAIVLVDVVSRIDPEHRAVTRRTRMRTGLITNELPLSDREHRLTRSDIDRIVQSGDERGL